MTAYDFKDILLVPTHSSSRYNSRKEVDLEQVINFPNGMVWKGIPIICSNIHNIATIEMAKALQEFKIITWLSKSIDYDSVRKEIDNGTLDPNYIGFSFGLNEQRSFREILVLFPEVPFIRLDVANGYMESFQRFVKHVCEEFGSSKIIFAGNILPHPYDFTANYGALQEYESIPNLAGVVVGIGSGGLCSTRTMTGIGLPQYTAIKEAGDTMVSDVMLVSDGGIRTAGDVVKAFHAGAEFVVIGSMFAGHDQCLGETVFEKITISGSASKESPTNLALEEYPTYKTYEGITSVVFYKGDVRDTVTEILGGLRSAFTYLGVERYCEIGSAAYACSVNRTTDNI